MKNAPCLSGSLRVTGRPPHWGAGRPLRAAVRGGLWAGLALAAAACAVLPVQAQTTELVQLVNRLRAPGGACGGSAPPLVRRDSLDTVAAQLARGVSLQAATERATERMDAVRVLSFTGARQGREVEALVASRFCAQLLDPRLSALGVHAQGPQSWIVLAEPYAPDPGLSPQQVQQRMLTLVNAARAQARDCGPTRHAAAPAVQWSFTLELAARGHANDMAAQDYFSHTARDGSTPAQRVARAGYAYRLTGENIAGGQRTPEDAVAGWLRSPGHCANLMHPGYREMAVAYAVNTQAKLGVYWVQQFGTPR